MSVKEITADNSIGISRSGFYHLLKGRDGELLDRYAQARAMQAVRLAGEIISIADGANNDTVNKARLQFDARRWMAGKASARSRYFGPISWPSIPAARWCPTCWPTAAPPSPTAPSAG